MSPLKNIKRMHSKVRKIGRSKAWKFYLQYFRKDSYMLVISFFLTLGQAAVFLPIAFILRKILNRYIPQGDINAIYLAGLSVAGLVIAHMAIRLANKRLILLHNKQIHNRIRDDLFKKIYDVPKIFYNKLEGVRWHTIFLHDLLHLDAMSATLFTNFIPAIVICIGLAGVMIYINTTLFLIMISVVPLMFLTMLFTTGKMRRLVFTRRRAFQTYSKRVQFAISMMDLTRIQVAEEEEIAKQQAHNAYMRSLDIRTAWVHEIYHSLQETFILMMSIILVVGGGFAAIGHSLSMGDLFTFYLVFMFARRYMFQLIGFTPTVIHGNEALERVYEIVAVDAKNPYSGKQLPGAGSTIEFEHVHFAYDSNPLLEDLNFTIGEGEFVALQGDNGSGKTTLLNMILGFYRPNSGTVSFGGVPYEDLDIQALRKEFGVVLQESPVFRGTITENIMYGRKDADKAAFDEALKLSGVIDFVNEQPKGLKTEIGDRGVMLSGGQRQRIAIARALLTRPKVLILDEPTNHLDKATVHALLDNLRNLDYQPTIIVISHLDALAQKADRILRIEEGKVMEITPARA